MPGQGGSTDPYLLDHGRVMGWVVRYQVQRESILKITEEAQEEYPTITDSEVWRAIREMAEFIGMPLRPRRRGK